MKTLLIGNTSCHAVKRLQEEFQKKKLVFHVLQPRDCVFSIQNEKVHFTSKKGEDLLIYDVYIFRGIGLRVKELSVIASYLHEHKKLIFEEVLATHTGYIDKFSPAMVDNGVPVVDYTLLFSKNEEAHIEYPIIAKSLEGSMGTKVRLLCNDEEYDTFIKNFGFPLLLQRYLPVAFDFRVLVVDGKVLGSMKRYNDGYDFLTIRAGGSREHVELPETALEIARKATEASGLSVAGVDLLEYEGTFYRLEVNMSPQFRVFEKITGVNVACAICEMIEKRYKKHVALQ
jgi:glutathione synthase/RimK-type ligase-like ATP-grasp enzyme